MPSIVGLTEWLSDSERTGWNNGAYHKTLTDKHLVLLCRKYAADLEKLNPEWAKNLPAPPSEGAQAKEDGALLNGGDFSGGDAVVAVDDEIEKANYRDEDEDAATGANDLSEETHLFAKFTCTYKIWDFITRESEGHEPEFPQNELKPAALVFSDLSGFSKLCEAYVEKFSGNSSQMSMSQAAEKLNVVVNQVFALQIQLVNQYNGDVVNFAGDAMFVVFRDEDLSLAAARAVSCSLDMLDETQKRLKAYEEKGMDALDTHLFLHIGIGAGNIRCMTFGGSFDKAEFVVAGPALTEAKDCGELAKCGEAILSGTVLGLIGPTEPIVQKLPPERLGVDGVEGSDFYVVSGMQRKPSMPERTARSEALQALRQCDNSTGAVEEAMRRFVPHSISACVDSGQSPKEAEEGRRVTIMFIRLLDLECEPFDYSKADTVNLVQRSILEIYALLHRYEGTVSRFQIDDKGTVLKVVFGFPMMAHEDDPVRAVHCAIEIRKSLKAIKVQSCVGIATGTTMCGLVGNEVRMEYTAVGSAVILAARLMQNANCCILVNAETMKMSSGSAVFEKICSIKVKGRDAKVPVWRPVETERRMTKKLAPIRDGSHILGREEELDSLKTLMDQYISTWGGDGLSPFVAITGQPGIGKAVVLARFLGVVGKKHTQLRVLKASGEDIESKTPYYPWKQIFASLVGVDAGAKTTQFTHRACVNALASLMGSDFEKNSVLNDVLPVNFSQEPGQPLDSRRRRDKLAELLCELLNKSAEKQPTMLVLHAMQWCDNSSWALLKEVLGTCPTIFVIMTTRTSMTDDDMSLLRAEVRWPVSQLSLQPLSPVLATQLVKKTLAVSELDQGIADVVMDRTQGIPLYCVEFARAVKDSGGELKELPGTITGAILLRIDKLLPSPKLVLKIIAVAGKDVRPALIADVVPAKFTEEELQQELEYLVSLDILIRDRNGYCFRHEMVQEVVRGFLTFSQKRFLHERVASYYVRLTNAEVSPAILANHFEEAAKGMDASELDVPTCKRAIWFLKVAAEEAMKANAIEDANKYLARCHALMQMLPTSADPFDFEMALGLVDGNEQLLRQVLEQFVANSGGALQRIRDLAGPQRTGDDGRAEGLATVRFEARSIASAASTLGAALLSNAAIAVENAALESDQGLDARVAELTAAFNELCSFVHTMSTAGKGLGKGGGAGAELRQGGAPAGREDKGGEQLQEQGRFQIIEEMMRDTLFAAE